MSESWASSPAIRRSMQGNKSRDTSPELAVRRAVHAAGLRYRVGTRPIATLNRRADLVFRRAKVAVFVDGCFWHSCPNHFIAPRSNVDYWTGKIGRNIERDRQTDAVLQAAGWIALRVWEHEKPESAAATIVEAVRLRLPRLDGRARQLG